MTVKYLGDANFLGNTSGSLNVTITRATTTTTLTASPNPALQGSGVTLRATIGVVSPSSGVATGTVEFFNGSTSLGTATLSGGVATLVTTTLPVGSNTLTAVYSGDSHYHGSASGGVIETITSSSSHNSVVAGGDTLGALFSVSVAVPFSSPVKSSLSLGRFSVFAAALQRRVTFALSGVRLGTTALSAASSGKANSALNTHSTGVNAGRVNPSLTNDVVAPSHKLHATEVRSRGGRNRLG